MRRLLARASTLIALALAVAGCGSTGISESDEVSRGKTLFQEACVQCHALRDAGSTAVTGPDLDAAFAQSRRDGIPESTIQQVVRGQIAFAVPPMPQNLVRGEDADAVAAYVAAVAGLPVKGGQAGQAAGEQQEASGSDGKSVFASAGCGGCHTFAPAGTQATVGPDLDELAAVADQRPGESPEQYVEEAIVNPDAYVVQGFSPGIMPGNYGELLEPEQLELLVQYLLNPEGG